jgi:hypothetical protein
MGPCCIVKAEGALCLIYGFKKEKPLRIGRDVVREVIGDEGDELNRRVYFECSGLVREAVPDD